MDRLLANMVIWYGTHRRAATVRRTPASFGLSYSEVAFPSHSPDAPQIRGWLVPARNPRGVVVLCHGIDSNASSMLPKAAMLRTHDYTSLLFDFRATGRSDGAFVSLGLHEAADVLGAVDFLNRTPETAELPIMAIGESMGGSAVIRAAASCPSIRAVVSESTYATLSDALSRRLAPLGPYANRVAKRCRQIGADRYGIDIADVSPERDIAALSPRPLLVIHDNFDVLCPRAETDRLFAAAREPKERWDVPYAPHTFAYFVAPREYERRVVDFLDRSLCISTSAAA